MEDGGSSTEPKMGSDSSLMAEEKGFEPLRPFTSLRAFQARPFSLLGIPPNTFFILQQNYIFVIKKNI